MIRYFCYFLFIVVFFSSNLSAQNTAIINTDSIYKTFPSYETHKKEYAEMVKNYQNLIKTDLSDLQNNLNRLIGKYNPKPNEAYESLKKRMLPSDIETLNLILKEEKNIQVKEKNYTEAAQFFYEQKIKSIDEKIKNTIEYYCLAHKIDIVFEQKHLKSIAIYHTFKSITLAIITQLKP